MSELLLKKLAPVPVLFAVLLSACSNNGFQRIPPLGPDGYSSLVYVAAGAGASRLEPDVEGADDVVLVEDSAPAGSLTLGIDTSQRTAVELQLAHLGDAELNTGASVTYRTGSVMLAGRLFEQRHGFNLYGKLGVGSLQSSDPTAPGVNVVTNNNFNLATGVGVEYLARNGLGLRFEYVGHDTDAQFAGLNVVYHFGGASNSRKANQPVLVSNPVTEQNTVAIESEPVPVAETEPAIVRAPVAEAETTVAPSVVVSEPIVVAQPDLVDRPLVQAQAPSVAQAPSSRPTVVQPSVAQPSATIDRPIIVPVQEPQPTVAVVEEPVNPVNTTETAAEVTPEVQLPEPVVVEQTSASPNQSMDWDVEVTENQSEFVETRNQPARQPAPRVVTPTPEPAPQPAPEPPADTDADGVPDPTDECGTTPDGVPVNDTGCERYAGVLPGVGFVEASSSLSPDSLSRLDQLANDIKEYTELDLEFQVQSAGNSEEAQLLARRRTLEVFRYLRARGVSAIRLRALPPAIGAGESARNPGVIMRRKTAF